jgi:hypothetical protein
MALKEIAQVRYGIVYNRMTLPLAVFRHLIQCVEFQNAARLFLAPNVSFVNLTIQNTDQMRNLAQNVLGLEVIETYDGRFWTQDDAGSLTSNRFWPINKVALTDSASGRQSPSRRLRARSANRGDCFEYGADFDDWTHPAWNLWPGRLRFVRHNPPQLTYWAVDRGWSRKLILQESAVIKVAPDSGAGSITEYISTSEPAF